MPDFLNPCKKKDDEPSSKDVSQGKRRSPRFSTKKRKLSNGKSTEGSISWDQINLDLDTSASVANARLVNYRKAVEKIKSYLDSIEKLQVRLYLLYCSFVYYIWSHLYLFVSMSPLASAKSFG